MRKSSLTLLALSTLCLAGCGALSGVLATRDARCDLRPKDDQCTDLRDFRGPSFITFQGVCNTLKSASGAGEYKEDARCDTTGAVGGCQSTSADGTKQTNWYYSGAKYKAKADVEAECDSGQSYVAP